MAKYVVVHDKVVKVRETIRRTEPIPVHIPKESLKDFSYENKGLLEYLGWK